MEIVVGGNIIIPILINVDATTMSITINGMYIKNPIQKAILSSLSIKLGNSTDIGISSKLVPSQDSPAISINN